MKRPLISLGDALRVLAILEPSDDSALEEIHRMLGFHVQPKTPAPRSIGAWKPSSSNTIATAQRSQPRASGSFSTTQQDPERLRPAVDRSVLPSRVKRVRTGTGAFDPPSWVSEAGEVLGPLEDAGPALPPEPLFNRVVRRSILSTAVATNVAEGDLNIDAMLEILSQGRALESLPRLSSPTLRRGVQILLDRSEGMDPFLEDQGQLVRALDDILADDRLESLYFAGCPSRGVGRGPRNTWAAWKAPAPGVPVLAVTDLGIGGPALDEERPTVSEWLAFAQNVRSHGHLLLGLVPYEALRWPPVLSRSMILLHWSERTTVGEIRRAMRESRRRLR